GAGPDAVAVRGASHRSDQDRVTPAARAAVGVLLLPRPERASPRAARGAGARRRQAPRAAPQDTGLVRRGARPGVVMDIRHLVPEWIRTLTPYPPGKPIEEGERELGISGSIKLASNENPLGPSPKAMAAVAEALRTVHLYPDGSAFYLCRRLAERHGVSPDDILVGNGSNEIIELIVRTFLRPPDEAVVAAEGSVIYRRVGRAAPAPPRVPPPRTSPHAPEARGGGGPAPPRLVSRPNPNNPTGTFFRRSAGGASLRALPPRQLLVVADDA